MKALTFLALAGAVVSTTCTLTLNPRSANPRVVSTNLERRRPNDVLAYDRARLRGRANTVEETLDNEETLYFANISIGTPAQSMRLHIDTGSSDMWVNVKNSSLCSHGNNCIGGTFDSDASSSLTIVNSDFNISYVDGSSASGDYVKDTIVFGGVTLTQFEFGLGETSGSYEGVLGIGYTSNEVEVQRARKTAYANLPKAMVDGGLIARNAYSLWLNDLDASTGTILFGGVNKAKYSGELATVPIIQQSGGYFEFIIALTAMTIDGQAISSSSFAAPVLLDSGSTLIYLPNDIAEVIYNATGAVYDENSGIAYAPCSLAEEEKTVEFTFSGQTISVDYNELILDSGTSGGAQLQIGNSKTQACIFGIQPAQGSTPVLGDTFLRSAYVVYDLTNNEISLAQTVFNTTADDVQEIAAGTSLVPGATAVASPVTTVATGTSAADHNGVTTGKVTSGSMPRAIAPEMLIISSAVGVSLLAGAGILIF